MAKKKLPEEDLLKHNLIIRVNDSTYLKLNKLLKESECQTLADVARKIIANQKVNCVFKDASMDAPMEELALIRKELKAIGVNINQQTRYFNACKTDSERRFHSERTIAQLDKLEPMANKLFTLISKLAGKWLQR